MTLNGFKTKKSFHYENGFYACADDRRFSKFFAHYELYKKIINLPGDIVECGIFKGNSFFHFRNILETQHSRKIIGFDMFGKFPPRHILKQTRNCVKDLWLKQEMALSLKK